MEYKFRDFFKLLLLQRRDRFFRFIAIVAIMTLLSSLVVNLIFYLLGFFDASTVTRKSFLVGETNLEITVVEKGSNVVLLLNLVFLAFSLAFVVLPLFLIFTSVLVTASKLAKLYRRAARESDIFKDSKGELGEDLVKLLVVTLSEERVKERLKRLLFPTEILRKIEANALTLNIHQESWRYGVNPDRSSKSFFQTVKFSGLNSPAISSILKREGLNGSKFSVCPRGFLSSINLLTFLFLLFVAIISSLQVLGVFLLYMVSLNPFISFFLPFFLGYSAISISLFLTRKACIFFLHKASLTDYYKNVLKQEGQANVEGAVELIYPLNVKVTSIHLSPSILDALFSSSLGCAFSPLREELASKPLLLRFEGREVSCLQLEGVKSEEKLSQGKDI